MGIFRRRPKISETDRELAARYLRELDRLQALTNVEVDIYKAVQTRLRGVPELDEAAVGEMVAATRRLYAALDEIERAHQATPGIPDIAGRVFATSQEAFTQQRRWAEIQLAGQEGLAQGFTDEWGLRRNLEERQRAEQALAQLRAAAAQETMRLTKELALPVEMYRQWMQLVQEEVDQRRRSAER